MKCKPQNNNPLSNYKPKPKMDSQATPPSYHLYYHFCQSKTFNVPAYLFCKFHYDSFCTLFKFIFCILFLLFQGDSYICIWTFFPVIQPINLENTVTCHLMQLIKGHLCDYVTPSVRNTLPANSHLFAPVIKLVSLYLL